LRESLVLLSDAEKRKRRNAGTTTNSAGGSGRLSGDATRAVGVHQNSGERREGGRDLSRRRRRKGSRFDCRRKLLVEGECRGWRNVVVGEGERGGRGRSRSGRSGKRRRRLLVLLGNEVGQRRRRVGVDAVSGGVGHDSAKSSRGDEEGREERKGSRKRGRLFGPS
jgi:hypothetical protein